MTEPPLPPRAKPAVRLPRLGRFVLVLAAVDAGLLGASVWAETHGPERLPAWLALLALASFLGFLIQCGAWIGVIAFFARERARDGLLVCALLASQVACLVAVLLLAARAAGRFT